MEKLQHQKDDDLSGVELGEDMAAETAITEEAIAQLELAKLFSQQNGLWETQTKGVGATIGKDLLKLQRWCMSMNDQILKHNTTLTTVEEGTDEGAVELTHDEGSTQRQEDKESRPTVEPKALETYVAQELKDIGQDGLLTDQRRAFDIIEWHLQETLARCEVPQLLMQIHGKGGTGKLKVIRTVTDTFQALGADEMLTRSAYTGIAASIIDGKTLHTIAAILMNGGLPSSDSIC
ncbi:hypothetical protein FRB95_003284 [Tulasnella sp. JGI-2019a]|nr:hypothetical protein FRB95_003284 [Tulasnella sp. JGI-2019a]